MAWRCSVAVIIGAASPVAAVQGASPAYLGYPVVVKAQARQQRFADLAVRAGVRHLVVLSQLAADEHSPVRFCPTTLLRPDRRRDGQGRGRARRGHGRGHGSRSPPPLA
ncbi:MAG: hypothetical protein ACRDPA_23845 [Solirubrobacteraceae bacterium]